MSIEFIGSHPVAPLSIAVKANGFLFVSGAVGVDPATGALVEGGISEQTRCVMENLKKNLADADVPMANVVRCNVYLTDMTDFSAMNAVYKEYFPSNAPTRTTVGVSGLANPKFLVEIDLIAAL